MWDSSLGEKINQKRKRVEHAYPAIRRVPSKKKMPASKSA